MVLIKEVCADSYVDKAGIKGGDMLFSVNGYEIRDVLDYRYRTIAKKLEIEYIRNGEKLKTIIIKKDEYDELGFEFETYLMDEKQSCMNKCIFCFVDQNPRGMRETIYFKDDDSRLSFLMGNYVTLTNMSDEDIDRIIEMRMSPVNISVHTMDPELRVKMMKNKNAGKVLSYIDRLHEAGIELNFQIVLCRSVNDGDNLTYTMRKMEKYHDTLIGVSVVPAGLTKYRDKLYPLEPFTKEECAEIIESVNAFGDRCKIEYGKRLFFCADEFYLKAEMPLPEADYYEDYPQLEDGIGTIRSSEDEVNDELSYTEVETLEKIRELSIATGEAAYDFICRTVEKIEKMTQGKTKCRVYKIKNDFFGENISVAGLLTGSDIYTQLKDKSLGERLLVPAVAVRREGELFLDNMSLEELGEKLGVAAFAVSNDGADIVSNILY
ncbi:MAG: DUF512 domain-containing protein [Ruminococcaceae bacterium]|nr:DUF512 domain-containing protein [Oscillospiraceae bacterium]